jgi:predicted ester cyclase
MVHDSFSDLHFTVEDMVAEGDKVVYRYSVRGTHKGSFMGIAPTGEQFAVTGIHIYRVADGKLQEEWENWDMLGLMRQLGVIPQPAAIA